MTEALRAPHSVAFSYRRTVGGATQRFLAGLARGEIWGAHFPVRGVVVPPVDHDPHTGAAPIELVRVSDAGVVRAWTWVTEPRPEHPLDRPFAFALVQLDGADTTLFHVADVGGERDMQSGMRVRADWRPTRTGSILDIRAFVPGESASAIRAGEAETGAVQSDMRLDYTYEPGHVLSGFLRSLGERHIQGGRCPSCSKVYVPPRPRCPVCGAGPMDLVPMLDRGTIVSYTVVHAGTDLPFAWAWIHLDEADVPFAHLLGDVAPDDVRVGQRVEAVWVADSDLGPTWESIRHFRPVPV